jgi:hypothetical protein
MTTQSERMKAYWAKRRAEKQTNENNASDDMQFSEVPRLEDWDPPNGFVAVNAEIEKKLDAILDVLSNNIKTATELAQIMVAISSLREKLSKLHLKRYAGVEYSSSQLIGMMGVTTEVGRVEENRVFWENIKLALVEALMRIEGFVPGNPGYFKVGQ